MVSLDADIAGMPSCHVILQFSLKSRPSVIVEVKCFKLILPAVFDKQNAIKISASQTAFFCIFRSVVHIFFFFGGGGSLKVIKYLNFYAH